jgi:ATP-dependent protease ClpP protease subunit
MQERIIKFVSTNSNLKPERFREMMMKTGDMMTEVGTVLDGEDAVTEGLIDHFGRPFGCDPGFVYDDRRRGRDEPC